MELSEAKQAFIETWGKLGAQWGINRTMAQVHAALLVSDTSQSTDELMAQLQVSRGNANTNLRALLDWKLIEKELRPGVRKEYYRAEQDPWKMGRRIAAERWRRELEPLMTALARLHEVKGSTRSEQAEVDRFLDLVSGIERLGAHALRLVDTLLAVDEGLLVSALKRVRGKSKS